MPHTNKTGYPAGIDSEGKAYPAGQIRVDLSEAEEEELVENTRLHELEKIEHAAEDERIANLKTAARAKLKAIAGLSDEEIDSLVNTPDELPE
jgi:hypothetical protein